MRFRSDPAKIRGSIAPLVSPFTAELRLLAAGAAVLEGPVAKVAREGGPVAEWAWPPPRSE